VIEAPPADGGAHRAEPAARRGLDRYLATGYDLDYGWIGAPVLDELGYPRNVRGVATFPGLYFLGLLWQHSQASASVIGPQLDAPHLIDAMADHAPRGAVNTARFCGVDHSRDEGRNKAAQRSS
jgi:hypothetical protein